MVQKRKAQKAEGAQGLPKVPDVVRFVLERIEKRKGELFLPAPALSALTQRLAKMAGDELRNEVLALVQLAFVLNQEKAKSPSHAVVDQILNILNERVVPDRASQGPARDHFDNRSPVATRAEAAKRT